MYITTVRRAVFAIGVGVDIGTDADVYQTRLSQGFLAGVVCVCVCQPYRWVDIRVLHVQ